MTELLLQTFYFILPAYIANMAPVVAHRLNLIPRLGQPIDGGMRLRGQSLFGETKTWRGLVVGVAAAMFVGTIQFFLWQFDVIRLNSVIDFSVVDPLVFGFIGGLGALLGDVTKSLIKRRFNIGSGKPWPVFDQLDFIIGYFVATSFIVSFNSGIFLMAIALTLVLHPLTNIAAYIMKIKNVWW